MKCIFFFGLSGVGKSTLIHQLAEAYPHCFFVPRRLTTREPKAGDFEGELEHVARDEFLRLKESDELLLSMVRDQTVPREEWSYSGYRLCDVVQDHNGGSRIALLFASVFSLQEVLVMGKQQSQCTVHVVADWRAGLAQRGGDPQVIASRIDLNTRLESHFSLEALGSKLDIVFRNEMRNDDCPRLFGRIMGYASASTMESSLSPEPRPLSSFAPYIVTANVRWKVPFGDISVDSTALGHEGDLVLGDVLVPPSGLKLFDSRRHLHTFATGRVRVVAILGNRESSTHCNGAVPEEGLATGSVCHWIAGESGLVGRLVLDSAPNPVTAAESAIQFDMLGVLRRHAQETLNIEDFAVATAATCPVARLSKPIVLVCGTAAEVGKTTLTRKVIAALEQQGKRVAAIKTIGTGGIKDTAEHIQAGALVTLDQVNAGLITTYCSEEKFRNRIMRSYRAAEAAGANIIVAECGGDICWANAPTLFCMPEFLDNLSNVLLLTNNALDALGAENFLRTFCPQIISPSTSFHIFASPFRNVSGMRARANVLKLHGGTMMDPNCEEDIRTALESVDMQRKDGPATAPATATATATLDARDGQPVLMQKFWEQIGSRVPPLSIHSREAAIYHHREIYHVDNLNPSQSHHHLPLQIIAMHRQEGNFNTKGKILVIGAGARQLTLAAAYAVRFVVGERLALSSPAPFYALYGRMHQVHPELGGWNGSASPAPYKGALRHDHEAPPSSSSAAATRLRIVSLPSNPLGSSECEEVANHTIYDLSYYWSHLHPRSVRDSQWSLPARDDDIAIFSLSKLTGHAGSRIGWCFVKSPNIANAMNEYIHHSAIRTSYEAQKRAAHILLHLHREKGALFRAMVAYVQETMRSRWARLRPLLVKLTKSGEGAELWTCISQDSWCYLVLQLSGSVDAASTLRKLTGIVGYPGKNMGMPSIVRISLGVDDATFEAICLRLERLHQQ